MQYCVSFEETMMLYSQHLHQSSCGIGQLLCLKATDCLAKKIITTIAVTETAISVFSLTGPL